MDISLNGDIKFKAWEYDTFVNFWWICNCYNKRQGLKNEIIILTSADFRLIGGENETIAWEIVFICVCKQFVNKLSSVNTFFDITAH
jgi:hypothetical protein